MANRRYAELRDLINHARHKERQCAEYLQYVPNLLFKETAVDVTFIEPEYRQHTGDSDCVIVGQVSDENGVNCVRAYIWELKAPQCYIFREDENNHNRLNPSDALIQAENQLLNYYDELMGSTRFLVESGITHPENVRMGGIIIGRLDRKVQGPSDDERKNRLYESAIRCRNRFYTPSGVRIMLWNVVLEQLKEQPPPEPIAPPEMTLDETPEITEGTISTFGD